MRSPVSTTQPPPPPPGETPGDGQLECTLSGSLHYIPEFAGENSVLGLLEAP